MKNTILKIITVLLVLLATSNLTGMQEQEKLCYILGMSILSICLVGFGEVVLKFNNNQ